MVRAACVCYEGRMGLLEWLDSLPGNLLALLALAFALWRYLDRKFECIDTQFMSLNRDIGEVKGELKAVQGQAHTHTPD